MVLHTINPTTAAMCIYTGIWKDIPCISEYILHIIIIIIHELKKMANQISLVVEFPEPEVSFIGSESLLY